MTFQKLNLKGFSHHLVLVIVVLAVAIGGTAYLVASHADSCPSVSGVSGPAVSEATVSGVSGSGCPVSSVSAPNLVCKNITATPSAPIVDKTFTVAIKLKNTGNKTATQIRTVLSEQDSSAGIYQFSTVTKGNLAPGKTKTITNTAYIPGPSNGKHLITTTISAVYNFNGATGLSGANCFRQWSTKD